jgi:GH43 family beta-xylosidase
MFGHQKYILFGLIGKNINDGFSFILCFFFSKRYVYFAANTRDGIIDGHRMFVLENTDADPFSGSFTLKGQITDPTNKWAIDGTAFEHPSGQLYFIWSGWEGDVNERQILYIAEMSNPWTINSKRVEISRPTLNWEINHKPNINEGPEVTIQNDVISLVYSASGSWTNDYCLGLITASTDSNPMDPASWKKHPEPIFKSGSNVLAPGHHSFTKSPDDKEDWIIYHSARYSGAGWNRQIRAQKFTWNADSTPNLGEPVDRNIPIQIPSGDQIRDRYEAEEACFSNGPSAISGSTVSTQNRAGFIEHPGNSVTFTIQCEMAGNYVIVIRNCNGSADKATATQWLTVNNGKPIEIYVVYSGWGMWGASMIRTDLAKGVNTLTFKKGNNDAEIDGIDVFLNTWPPIISF